MRRVERGAEYRITARGFRNVSAIADQGGDGDAAKLYDSAEDGVDVEEPVVTPEPESGRGRSK